MLHLCTNWETDSLTGGSTVWMVLIITTVVVTNIWHLQVANDNTWRCTYLLPGGVFSCYLRCIVLITWRCIFPVTQRCILTITWWYIQLSPGGVFICNPEVYLIDTQWCILTCNLEVFFEYYLRVQTIKNLWVICQDTCRCVLTYTFRLFNKLYPLETDQWHFLKRHIYDVVLCYVLIDERSRCWFNHVTC